MTRCPTPQGTNAERSRVSNRQAVMGHIQAAGEMGRAQIARNLGLSTQAVSNIIAELLHDGLLQEKGTLSSGRGLPAVQYGVNPQGGYALGVEIRPDAILAALLDLGGNTVATERRALTGVSPDQAVENVVAMRDAMQKTADVATDRLLGAGVVMPGPFGKTGISGHSSDLPQWQGVDPATVIADALALPIAWSNDANAAAMAERIGGVAQAVDTYAYLYFGAGLGLGLVSQGQLIPGAFGNAGEIGHIPVPGSGKLVPLESLLSRISVRSHMECAGVNASDMETLARLYRDGNPALGEWLINASLALSQATQIIENLFDPQTIILGGAMPADILDHLVAQTNVAEMSVANRDDNPLPRLQRGASGRMTATIGAASLILHRAFTPQSSVL